MATRFFEDLEVGTERTFGPVSVTAGDIVEFAERYDPLPFHLDEGAAAEHDFGGLVASGWHTACLSNRLIVENFRKDVANRAGLGADDLRFPAPLRAGDELTVHHEIAGKRPSESNPGAGVVRAAVEGVDGDGETVVSYHAVALVHRRDGG